MRALLAATVFLTSSVSSALAAESADAERNRFRWHVEKVLLEAGMDAGVYIKDGALLIFAPLNKPRVYAIVSSGEFLRESQKRGFPRVEFLDKRGVEGMWTFSVPKDGPVPRCDIKQRLCY